MKTIASVILALMCTVAYGQVENHTKEHSNLSQSGNSANISNSERYGVDYELVNYTFVNGDSSILETLDLEELISHRKPLEDIDISNLSTGITVRVYSIQKARARRDLTTPKQH